MTRLNKMKLGMKKYIYKGEQKVHIPSIGTFEPGKEYEVKGTIEHPFFEEVKKAKKNKKA